MGSLQSSFLACYGQDADDEGFLAATLPPFYSDTMLDNLNALENLPDDPTARLNLLQSVQTDLNDKAQHAGAGLGAGLGAVHAFSATVAVQISLSFPAKSHLNPAELNIHVNSCLRGMSDAGHIYGTGDQIVKVTLPAGCLAVWAEKNGTVLSSQAPLVRDVGQSSNPPEIITVAIQGKS